MRRFVWRLQRVLDIKTKEEELKKIELLKLTQLLTEKRSEVLYQKRILQDVINSLAAKEPRKRLGEQELFLKHSTTTNELIKELEALVTLYEAQQKERIAEVLELRRFKKSLEKLRLQAKTEFIKEQEKLEQKELDEMAAVGFARKNDPVLRQIVH